MTANELTQAIITYLNQLPCTVAWRNTSNPVPRRTYKGKKGVGDVICVSNGRHIEIEVKVGADTVSEDQIKHRAEIEAAGALYYVARDLDGFLDWAKQL